VPEEPAAGEDHGQAVFVGGLDDLLVADRAAGLDDGPHPGLRRSVDPVPEGEEGVGGECCLRYQCSPQPLSSVLGQRTGKHTHNSPLVHRHEERGSEPG